MSAAPRVVLDTNVWLDLLHFRDPATAALDFALAAGHVTAVIDGPCRAEWQRVLAYPALKLDETQRAALEHALDARCEVLCAPSSPTRLLPRCADADDQKFIELAYRSGARWLLSRDHDVLALARRTAREGLFEILAPAGWAMPTLAPPET